MVTTNNKLIIKNLDKFLDDLDDLSKIVSKYRSIKEMEKIERGIDKLITNIDDGKIKPTKSIGKKIKTKEWNYSLLAFY